MLPAVALLAVAGTGSAQAAQQVITSSGPLDHVYLNDNLACNATHTGDTVPEFFGGTDPGGCGTFLSTGGTGYGPSVGPTATAYTPVSQTPVAGSGTARDPYRVVTVVDVGSTGLRITQTDSYVVGLEQYRTDIAVSNSTGAAISATLYHAGDCYLQGSDLGYGYYDAPSHAIYCTANPNNTPAGRILGFSPITAGSHYVEGHYSTVWRDITASGTQFPDTCDCTTLQDNGAGLSWPITVPAQGATATSLVTTFSPTGVLASSPPTVSTVSPSSGPVAGGTSVTITGTGFTGATAVNFGTAAATAFTVDSAAQITAIAPPGSGSGSGTVHVTVTTLDGSSASSSADQYTYTPAAPRVSAQVPSVTGSQGVAFSATIDPNGQPTTMHFEYGLSSGYRAATDAIIYDQRTPEQPVGSDFNPHTVTATVAGLVPNAVYHVRAVATNSAGSAPGADQIFKTAIDPPPPPPVLGQQANFAPVSGVVFVRLPRGAKPAAPDNPSARAAIVKGRGFIPLTEARQLPVGSEVDARAGSLRITTAQTAGKRPKTQSGEFQSGLFQVLQSRQRRVRGLTVLQLLDSGVFPGAPSYKQCTATGKATDPGAHAARLNRKALQRLRAKAHGNFQTRGRYSAATVRGTEWDTTDRCDGTLTVVHRGTVIVTDYRLRKNITVPAGASYLAKA
jgi:hypothetical protein